MGGRGGYGGTIVGALILTVLSSLLSSLGLARGRPPGPVRRDHRRRRRGLHPGDRRDLMTARRRPRSAGPRRPRRERPDLRSRTAGSPTLDSTTGRHADGPYLAPGFVDVHVHGWGGHDAMGDPAALDGMARSLLRHGVTSFLPTAVTAPLGSLVAFAERVRAWLPDAPADGAEPLGFNLEGPFLAPARHGAHDPALLLVPTDVTGRDLEPLIDGLRLVTVAPELPGAIELIGWLHRARGGRLDRPLRRDGRGGAGRLRGRGDVDDAPVQRDERRRPSCARRGRGRAARRRGLRRAHRRRHPRRSRPVAAHHAAQATDRLVLVSDALAIAGTGDGRGRIGGLDVEVNGDRATLAGTTTLAGSVIALDTAVRNLVASGVSLPAAVGRRRTQPAGPARHLRSRPDRGRPARRSRRARRRSPGPPRHARRRLDRGRALAGLIGQRGGIAAIVRSMSSSIRTVASVTTSR